MPEPTTLVYEQIDDLQPFDAKAFAAGLVPPS